MFDVRVLNGKALRKYPRLLAPELQLTHHGVRGVEVPKQVTGMVHLP